MHILIIGSGIIGITTAYELLKLGYKVSIIDRQSKPANETSYGNAGLIAPGHSYAWTSPKLVSNLFKSIAIKKKIFRIKFQWDLDMWIWGLQFLSQCTSKKMKENTLRKHKISIYSQKYLKQLNNELNIKYHNNKGLIYIFQSPESFEDGKQKMSMLNLVMGNLQLLSKDELISIEPILKEVKQKIFGGIFCSTDESGSCHDFAVELTKICKQKGGKFYFNTTAKDFNVYNNRINSICTNRGNFSADKYVIACASYSPQLSKKIGDYLPIYPIKGYSITVPIINKDKAPIHSGIDEDNLLAFTLMGDKIRFTSKAEISGYDTSFKKEDFNEIIRQASSLFPKACNYSNVEYWCGLRPMTPNGVPIIRRSKIKNLFYNTGHGHLGWTMSVGSAKIITDIISGRIPDIDLENINFSLK